MGDDPRLSELLLEWQERWEQGHDVPPEELCRTCPELLPEVQRRIEAHKKLERL
jgi:hypothetical protein